jgi:sec-independent protein translocase protein TatC
MFGNLLPKVNLVDLPMGLGEHLDELRRRLVLPIAMFIVLFIIGFCYEGTLKIILVGPLLHAIRIVGPETATRVGLDLEQGPRVLTTFGMGESAMLSMDVAMIFAVVLTIPVLLYELWAFIATGLKRVERLLGLLLVPAGVAMFYLGLVFAYFIGLPYLQAWLIEWTANDPTMRHMDLRSATYYVDFLQFGIAFGLICDIPWLVVVLVRVGFVKREWLIKHRRIVVVANLALAAIITPTGDATTLLICFAPMQLLYELGLLVSRFFVPKQAVTSDA